MRGDQRVVAGMQPVQDRASLRRIRCARAGSERAPADMADEHVQRGHVPPAAVPGAQAEIVLLAIALREQVLAQRADLVEAVAPDIKAEADARPADLADLAAIGLLRQPVQRHRLAPGPGPGCRRRRPGS